MAAKKKDLVVTAVRLFADVASGKTYRPGQAVEGWDEARARHYAERGLVRIQAPEVDDGQMTIDEALSEPEDEALSEPEDEALSEPEDDKPASGKPGPEKTKPQTGGEGKK